MIPTFTKNVIALTNSVSDIASVAHHPAVFFTQSGTDCAPEKGPPITKTKTNNGTIKNIFIPLLNIVLLNLLQKF